MAETSVGAIVVWLLPIVVFGGLYAYMLVLAKRQLKVMQSQLAIFERIATAMERRQ